MLIPQFSIRWLLALTTVCGVIFSVFGLAVRGHYWAMGVSVGVVSLVVLMSIYAAMFAGVWIFSLLISAFSGRFAPSSNKDVPAAPVILE